MTSDRMRLWVVISSTEMSVRAILSKDLFSTIVSKRDIDNLDESTIKLHSTVTEFVKHSTTFLQCFLSKCKETPNSRKKLAKDVFFQILGYNPIFMPRNKEESSFVTKKRKKEEKMAFQKLVWENIDGRRVTSYWRKAQICDVCCQSSSFLERWDVMTNEVDKPFKLEKARKVVKFKKFEINSEDEISICSISRFETIMNGAVDSF